MYQLYLFCAKKLSPIVTTAGDTPLQLQIGISRREHFTGGHPPL
jgi:hypothetical protein